MVNTKRSVPALRETADAMRRKAIEMAFAAGNNGAHVGPGLSMIEILAVLYCGVMNLDPDRPTWADRDRFILSKGHGVLAYYTALSQAGFLSDQELACFEVNESILPGHPVMNPEKCIETSSGSLGMGLSLAIGIALSARSAGKGYSVYTLLGDGECAEGSVWEAAMSAAHFRLGNLTAIVDCNRLQYDGFTDDIMSLENFSDKWRAFGWDVAEVDGHDVQALLDAFAPERRSGERPYVVIARTVKGKGVSFMENKREWHHGRITKTQFEEAIAGLPSGGRDGS